jgi:hypothetical protein
MNLHECFLMVKQQVFVGEVRVSDEFRECIKKLSLNKKLHSSPNLMNLEFFCNTVEAKEFVL